jgi:hypothetical protein
MFLGSLQPLLAFQIAPDEEAATVSSLRVRSYLAVVGFPAVLAYIPAHGRGQTSYLTMLFVLVGQ